MESHLKPFLKFLRFDQRASLALHIPSILPIESSVPLRLDYFQFSDLSLTIDTVSYDFFEFWNFPVESPPSKKEVSRIRNQKHFGNLFIRKIDLNGRWEHVVPLELTQGEAEKKLIDFLIGRFEIVNIRRLRVDDVEDFLMRIGEKRLRIEELHVGIQNFKEFKTICGFLDERSFPLEKLEIEIGNLEFFELDDEFIKTSKLLKIKVDHHFNTVNLVQKYLSLTHEQGAKFILQVKNEQFILEIFKFLQQLYSLKECSLGNPFIMEDRKTGKWKGFGGQVEQTKNHLYDILEASFWWIFSLEFICD